jgi:hypothetical protein
MPHRRNGHRLDKPFFRNALRSSRIPPLNPIQSGGPTPLEERPPQPAALPARVHRKPTAGRSRKKRFQRRIGAAAGVSFITGMLVMVWLLSRGRTMSSPT